MIKENALARPAEDDHAVQDDPHRPRFLRAWLDRGLDSDPQPFGSPDYGKEELVAEMASAFLSAHAGIKPATIENQAAYLQGWLKQLRGDKRLVVAAAGAAQKAADWIRGERKPAY